MKLYHATDLDKLSDILLTSAKRVSTIEKETSNGR